MIIAVLSLLVCAFYTFGKLDRSDISISYYLWRIEKKDTTQADQFRTKNKMSGILVKKHMAKEAFTRLTDLLRKPGLTIERVDLILQSLLENRNFALANNINLPVLLTNSLRCANVYTRSRINQTLIFIAEDRQKVSDSTLKSWNPDNGDSTTDLEERIKLWLNFWQEE